VFAPLSPKKCKKIGKDVKLAIINKLLLNINNLNSQFSKESMQIFTQFYLQHARKKDLS